MMTDEQLLKIKVRVVHTSGAWLEEYFYLTVVNVTGISESRDVPGEIYPNPAQTVLNLKGFPEGSSYPLVSIDGTLIASGVTNGDGQLELRSIVDGVYFIRINVDGKFSWRKFVKISR